MAAEGDHGTDSSWASEPQMSSAAVLEEVAHADGGDQHGQRRRLAQRLIGQALDNNAQRGARDHRKHNGDERGQAEVLHGAEGDVRADHDDVAMRKVEHFSDAVHHRITQRDDGVNASQADAVDQVGKKQCHFIHLICLSRGRLKKRGRTLGVLLGLCPRPHQEPEVLGFPLSFIAAR